MPTFWLRRKAGWHEVLELSVHQSRRLGPSSGRHARRNGPRVGTVLALRGRDPSEVVLAAAFSSFFVRLAWADVERLVMLNYFVYPALALALAVSGVWPDRGPSEALAGGLGRSSFLVQSRSRWWRRDESRGPPEYPKAHSSR